MGNANLFFINPNGILFGSNASLDVNGSFVATTANAIRLGDTGLFSASEPAASNLLTIEPSALFFNSLSAQAIVNQSQAESLKGQPNSVGEPVGLQVPRNRTLALVGGDIVLEGGNLTALGGRIELGSVAGVGEVSITQNGNSWVLGYDGINDFGNIRIEGGALVDVSSRGGGSLQIQAAQLAMTQEAAIFADTLGSLAGQGVQINTTETVTLSENSLITSDVLPFGSGTGGDVTINTGSLIVQDGSLISTTTLGQGPGGNLTVTATEAVQLLGLNQSGEPSALVSGTQGFAPAGNLTINTGQLLIQGGAQAYTTTFGESRAGDLTVTASVIELAGSIEDGFSSGLFASADQGSTGDSGNLTIATDLLIVLDGAQVAVSTFGEGDAGDLSVTASEVRLIGTGVSLLTDSGLVGSGLIAGTQPGSTGTGGNLTIITDRLIVQDGAEVQVSTLSDGDAGDLNIKASESVELIGTTPGGEFGSALRAVAGLEGEITDVTGKGGDLIIETGQLIVRDGAQVTVSSANPSSDAQGAGNLEITAQTINLDDKAAIAATTASGDGGNISLQVQELLLLRRNSNISTTAGTAQAGGDGGNITINTKDGFIVAVLSEDSNITANAFTGSGGNVQITAQAVFGIEFREQETSLSDITASSEFGVDGTVVINTPNVDPTQGLANFSEQPVKTEVKEGCQAARQPSSLAFYYTGRGGIAPHPYEPISSNTIWDDLRLPTQEAENSANPSASSTTPSKKLVEAQGWIINEKGEVVLVAEIPTSNSGQFNCSHRAGQPQS